jgi:hypothetical protein
MEPAGKMRHGRPVNTWEDGIRDSMQRRNLKEKNVSIETSAGRKLCLLVKESCVPTENSYIYKRIKMELRNMEHLKRIDDMTISKEIFHYSPIGRRDIGCPKENGKLKMDQKDFLYSELMMMMTTMNIIIINIWLYASPSITTKINNSFVMISMPKNLSFILAYNRGKG